MTAKQDFEELWSFYPSGDKERAYEVYRGVLSQGIITFEGVAVTHDFLFQKYRKYVEWWDLSFGRREKKYISKEDRKQQVSQWLLTSGWDIEHAVTANVCRDKYLFGNIEKKEWEKRIERFCTKMRT